METVNSFLGASSIHGVSHIATSRKSFKLFWIFVVFSGFLMAGVLIQQAFKSWNENPITTTIETVPISEMTLPNITVCPPKNTFTDLNYELKITENMTIDNDTREELFNLAMDLLLNAHFLEVMKNQSVLQVEKRYFNWYHGYTEIERATHSYGQLHFFLTTTATTGTISTPDFGKKFNSSKIDPSVRLNVQINGPESFNTFDNHSFIIKLEFNLIKSISKGHGRFSFGMENLDDTNVTKNLTLPTINAPSFKLDRKVTLSEVGKLEMTMMPGFRAIWSYSEPLEPKNEFFRDWNMYPESIMYRK